MSSAQVLAAEWVLPVTSPPIPDGVVVIEGPNIAWVGARTELPARYLQSPFKVYPRSLLLPGWVNAHCHLNLTGAVGQIPGTAARFTDWIRAVIQFQSLLTPPLVAQSIIAGLDLLASTGTTTVAHVATLPELEPFLAHPLRTVVFHEVIGFPAERAERLAHEAEDWLDAAEALIENAGISRVTPGIAAHAPYTVSRELIRRLSALALTRKVPFSMHLAETEMEGGFLRTGEGPFRDLLKERGAWDDTWQPPRSSPVAYAADVGALRATGLAVHCNYLDDVDFARLKNGKLIPTWCPGSHLFFDHGPHPAARLVAEGVPVALGTDSLASNAGLSMLREIRLAAEACPQVPREAWLRGATVVAAEALGLGDRAGSLEVGKEADLQVLHGVPEGQTDPIQALFGAVLQVRGVWVQGERLRIK